MSDRTAIFMATVKNLPEDDLVNLIKDVENVGKEYGIRIFFDTMIEPPTESMLKAIEKENEVKSALTSEEKRFLAEYKDQNPSNKK